MNPTPEEPDAPSAELSAEQEDAVRRLLARARATEPMPEEVRLRLEGVLRDLTEDELPAGTISAPVADLAARRRRRVRTLFLAAAAVTAFGFAAPQLVQVTGSDFSTLSDGAAEDAPAPAAAAEDSDAAGGSTYATGPEEGAELDGLAPSAPPTLRASRFSQDAQALSARIYVANGLSSLDGLAPDCLAATGRTAAAKRTAIAVRYARRDAALLLGTPVDGRQRAILYVCGESEPRRTTLLTVR